MAVDGGGWRRFQSLWMIGIKFKNPKGGDISSFIFIAVTEHSNLNGHGLTFAVSVTMDLTSPPGQYLGLLNTSNVSSSAIFSLSSSTPSELQVLDLNLKSGKAIQAWIDYESGLHRISPYLI
ncbi:hypothetical protein NL676_012064 [Syzygium grande]|nr:hypothetical protein NL676_012064 [Syzygium grande]